jgi:CheY-like chemotaxis protein
MIFVLDDDIKRIEWFQEIFPNQLEYARSVAEALPKLRSNPYDIVFLDHDLAVGSSPAVDGIALADTLAKEGIQTSTPIIVHSMNPIGADNIRRALSRTHNVTIVPYSVLKIRLEERRQK